jgi:quercetin dioxygenase-like cupin family protein
MERMPPSPTTPGAAGWFLGEVWSDSIVQTDDPSRLRAQNVRFSPGARTAWHKHGVGQTLVITDGAGFVQSRDGDALAVRAGDVVYIPPDEWHWHGAAARSFMVHLALMEGTTSSRATGSVLGDQVTDEEYGAVAGMGD